MSTLIEQVISLPRLIEVDTIEVSAPPDEAWNAVRHGDLARSPLIKALFQLRALPQFLGGKAAAELHLKLDELKSSAQQPGFSVLLEAPGSEVVVGAIVKVWRGDIPFIHTPDAAAFERFAEPGWVKVAWALRVEAWGQTGSRISIEVWVDATDDDSWRRFKRYFRLIGPGSHFIRRSVLAMLSKELGSPHDRQNEIELPGDGRLPDAQTQVTHSIEIAASPAHIWPWLIQMGAGRAGFYSYDSLDNAGHPSAREVHPELGQLSVGSVIPATPDDPEGFEVLKIEQPRCLLLGGLYDVQSEHQLAFDDSRPEHFWQVTWAFILQPLDATHTRLLVRARAAFSSSQRWHATLQRPVHHFMQRAMLRHLASRVEGRLSKDGWHDVAAGMAGALWISLGMATPFLRGQRRHWGLDARAAERVHPGDDIVPEPDWSWTHGITVEMPATAVWPWVAQIGADRGGFYSYQWLENLVGCNLRNAERVHPEWQLALGDELVLHPRAPALQVTRMDAGHYFVANAGRESADVRQSWSRFSWLFWVEPLTQTRCRVISRARYACSKDFATRLINGPLLLEPVGFAMDRRMLLGIKQRAEQAALEPRRLAHVHPSDRIQDGVRAAVEP